MLRKGQRFTHELTGKQVSIAARGHYPDTVMVDVEPEKEGELPRRMEVYLKHLNETELATS
jgi:hypothetical protein